MTSLMQASFTAGEVSPRLGGRVDLAKYSSALSTCLNALPHPHGGVTRRPGTQYIATTADTAPSKLVRLVPFEYSKDQAYILEFGEDYIRFYMDGGQIQSFDSYTKFCMHPTGLNAGVVFTDANNATAKVVTTHGSVKIDAAESPFVSGVSAYFPGTSADYLSIPDHADLNMATAQHTLENWIKFETLPSDGEIIPLYCQRQDANNYVLLTLKNNGGTYSFDIAMNTASTIVYPVQNCTWTTPAIDTWYHIAEIRGWGAAANNWGMTVAGNNLSSTTLSTTWPDLTGDFQIGGGTIDNVYPTAHNGTYVKATTKYDNDHWPYYATDPSKVLGPPEAGNSWLALTATGTNQRFHIDIGTASVVTRVYYENYHAGGAETNRGVKNFTMWGSNNAAAFADLTYGTDTNWTQLTTSQNTLDQHSAVDGSDPKYLTVINSTAYRYYAFKFADNWAADAGLAMGIRRIELQRGESTAFNGWISEVRISKGIARWTADFIPPTVPYPLSSGSTVYDVTTTYLESELAAMNFCQSADTLYITHPDHPPAKLTRADHDDWTLADISFDWPPFLELNATTTTIDPNATAIGAVTCTSNASLFTTDWVGTAIKICGGYLNVASVQGISQCTGNIVSTLSDHTVTAAWSKGAWDEVEGYPSCVTFFEERLAFAATGNQPQTIWLSVSGDYENFNAKEGAVITDTDACTYTIQSSKVNAIQWLEPLKKLIAGTIGGEWIVGGTSDNPITPSDVSIHQDTAHGCSDIQPIRVGSILLFVQRAGQDTGKTIREFGYDFQIDAFKGTDLTILAEHFIRNNTIMAIAYQKVPYQILWCIRNDGDLIALTYLREHDVVGWSHHETDGTFESVAVIPGVEEDEVWFVVKRTISSTAVRYIERLKATWSGTTLADAFYVDCGLTYSGSAESTITGLTHLEGKSLNILADGVMNNATTVSGGSIVLAAAATKVQAGIPFTTDIETLRCAPVEVQGKKKRISEVTLRLFETAGNLLIGPDSNRLDTHNTGTAIYSDDFAGPFRAGYGTDGKLFIRKNDALPMTILAAIPELESYP